MSFLARVIANGVGLWVASLLVPGFFVAQQSELPAQIVVYGLISLVLSALHVLVRPIIAFLSLPLYILTFGLFALIVNTAMLALTAKITAGHSFQLTLTGFWAAFFGALVVTIAASIVNTVIGPRKH